VIYFAITFILINLPYFLIFKSFAFSRITSDWGAYGSYIAGITSIVNLFFFIILTIYVARLGKRNSDAQISTQEKITELQISAQKKIMLAQFRQSELNKLNEILYKPIFEVPDANSNSQSQLNSLNSISVAIFKLKIFQKQQQNLFPILNEDSSQGIISKLIDLYEYIVGCYNNPNDVHNINTNLQLEDLFESLDKFNKIMQNFILDNLNKN